MRSISRRKARQRLREQPRERPARRARGSGLRERRRAKDG